VSEGGRGFMQPKLVSSGNASSIFISWREFLNGEADIRWQSQEALRDHHMCKVLTFGASIESTE